MIVVQRHDAVFSLISHYTRRVDDFHLIVGPPTASSGISTGFLLIVPKQKDNVPARFPYMKNARRQMTKINELPL